MATYDLEEQEQIDELKTWWKIHGNKVTAIITVIALAAVGWQSWNWWQRKQSAEASMVYIALQAAAEKGDAKSARELAGKLIGNYGGTAYAGLAALVSAKAQEAAGDPKQAKAQLSWAADNAGDEAVRSLAKLRLAALALDEGAYDEVARLLSGEFPTAFAVRAGELKGDSLAAQGKKDEAKAAYSAAITAAETARKDKANGGVFATYGDLLRDKLAVVGGAK